MKKPSKKSVASPERLRILLELDSSVVQGITKLSEKFPLQDSTGKRYCGIEQVANQAYSIILLALAHIELISPVFEADINYCEAEGVNQATYFNSMIDLKFKKKMHLKPAKRKLF